ncbi:hypothetical protein Ancab_028479 [Ancistrocladus abbreviatus]
MTKYDPSLFELLEEEEVASMAIDDHEVKLGVGVEEVAPKAEGDKLILLGASEELTVKARTSEHTLVVEADIGAILGSN